MDYQFSVPWFVVGFLITVVGGVFMKYHQFVADNFGGGLGSYDRYKLAAVIVIVFGLLSMVNLPIWFLSWFFGLLFGGLVNG